MNRNTTLRLNTEINLYHIPLNKDKSPNTTCPVNFTSGPRRVEYTLFSLIPL